MNRRDRALPADRLAALDGVELMPLDDLSSCDAQHVVVDVSETAPLSRDRLQTVRSAENVFARRCFHPGCHKLAPYAEPEPGAGARLPHTERATDDVLLLPTGMATGEAEFDGPCDVLRTALADAPRIREIVPRTVWVWR